ncbi:acetoacetyl-CoA reductase [Solimonas sp. K1W22B-7]|uniref:acetoacetyl-CoA reductase n=1 Tax=Solimonas sp. K1W22B-7 TaxID=2303331 RepID=UPI000E32E623|nr:acetoacetyl-CoA reductase [Solimonas sp. K1W22B-7]AXQ30296.1 acetoacetyl-CoA reductase [Solimonas sp. K1W22B-7]
MRIDLAGRVALVTGGTGAIGSRICAELAQAGARVVANCAESDLDAARQQQRRWQAEGLEIALEPFDVAGFEACAAAIGRIGRIDILVNCAGITRDAPLRRMQPQQWQDVLRVNLDSVFNTSRHVVEGMSERGWGRIVNISSVNGQKGQFGQTNYSASKAGVHGFTMALAAETARKGVTVNTVSPGYIDSPMIRAVPEDIRGRILEGIPAGRFGQPQDIATAVTFLCAEQSGFITGANLPVNGGQFISF